MSQQTSGNIKTGALELRGTPSLQKSPANCGKSLYLGFSTSAIVLDMLVSNITNS
jgi:hypothetical protein